MNVPGFIVQEIDEFDKILDDLVVKTGPQGYQETTEMSLIWWRTRLENAIASFDSLTPELQQSSYGQWLQKRIAGLRDIIIPRYEQRLLDFQEIHAFMLDVSTRFNELIE